MDGSSKRKRIKVTASTTRRALAESHDNGTGGGETELWTEPAGAVNSGVDLWGRMSPVTADYPGCGAIRGDLFARSKAREEECEERPAAFERVSPRGGAGVKTPHENGKELI